MKKPKKKHSRSKLEREVANGYAAFCKRKKLPLPAKWGKRRAA